MRLKDWLIKAKKEKWALGAFNVGNLETFKAIVQAAVSKKSPIIIESSPGEIKWLGVKNIIDLTKNYRNEYKIPIFLNLDHANNFDQCMEGIKAGYDLIHFDGSKLTFEDNLATLTKIVQYAHRQGVLVEGEMDWISGSSEIHEGSALIEIDKHNFTDPQKAKLFVEKSGVDLLAVFLGNVHGIFTKGGENLDLARLDQLNRVLPETFFSLHGGSGIVDYQIHEAIQRGVVKININTEMRQAFRENLEKALKEKPAEIAMYKIEPEVVKTVQKIVEHKMLVFGSAGRI